MSNRSTTYQADGRSLSRRRLLGYGVTGALVMAAGGCIVDADESPPATPARGSPAAFVPGPVPGFDDPKRWAGKTLRVGAWGGEVQTALREAVWRPFGLATGCTVHEATTDYSQLIDAIQSRRPYADVLVVDAIWAVNAPAEGHIQPLDTGIDRSGLSPIAGGPHSVPAFAYAMVSAYRRDVPVDGPPRTWAEWWDATRFQGPRALPKDAEGSFEFALMADGVAPAALYPLNADRAIARLRAISPRIGNRFWWDSGDQPVNWLGRRRVDLAGAWHYRVVAGQQDGYPLEMTWNQGLLVADHWVVPSVAEEPEVAMDFIRYALAPEVQAALARSVPLGPVVPAAFTLIDARTAARLPTAPENVGGLVPQNAVWWAEHGGEAKERFNNWLLGVPGA